MPRFRAAGIFISSSSQIFSLTFIIRKVDQSRKIIQTRWFLLYSPLIHLQSQSRRGRPTAVHLYTIPAGIIYMLLAMDGWETKPQSGAKQARSSIDPYILLKPKKKWAY